jgi:hypothetical protein
MGIVRRLRALLRLDRERNGAEPMPFSLVLLMRKPFLVSKPMLEAAGSAAFGVPYDGSDPMYFVVQEGATMMKAGPYLIQVLHKWGAYLGATKDDTETGAALLPEPQRAMWREQRAWASFDLWNEDVPESQAFHVLSSLVLRLTNERCCGIWIHRRFAFYRTMVLRS